MTTTNYPFRKVSSEDDPVSPARHKLIVDQYRREASKMEALLRAVHRDWEVDGEVSPGTAYAISNYLSGIDGP